MMRDLHAHVRVGACWFLRFISSGCAMTIIKCVFRIPDKSGIKKKMVYASSQDALLKKLPGLACVHQATDFDELVEEDIINKISANRTK